MPDPGNDSSSQPPPPGWQPPPPPPPAYAAPPGPVPGPGSAPYGQPPYGQPPYGQPPYGQPQYSQPQYSQPQYTQPHYNQPQATAPARGMLGAAHKPGAIPLRPLGLGDIYDAAFRIIRFNPKATVGSAALVAAIAFVLPVLVTAVFSFAGELTFDSESNELADVMPLLGVAGALLVGVAVSAVGTVLVTGLIAQVTAAAAIGRRLSLGEAWAATRGKRWRLLGLTAVLATAGMLIVGAYVLLWVLVVVASGDEVAPIVLWGLFSFPVICCAMLAFWIRVYYLPVPALMMEPIGVFGAIARGYRLTRGQFWRTLGIALLTVLLVGVAANIIAAPFSFAAPLAAGAAPERFALLAAVAAQALIQVVSSALITPFISTVTSLQYLDQRMRKEAYDVELMRLAGVTASS